MVQKTHAIDRRRMGNQQETHYRNDLRIAREKSRNQLSPHLLKAMPFVSTTTMEASMVYAPTPTNSAIEIFLKYSQAFKLPVPELSFLSEEAVPQKLSHRSVVCSARFISSVIQDLTEGAICGSAESAFLARDS